MLLCVLFVDALVYSSAQDLFLASNRPTRVQTPSSSNGPFGSIDILPKELPNETLDSQMSRMAMGAYLISGIWSDDRYKAFGEWELKVSYAPTETKAGIVEALGFGIYQRGQECTLTFAGTKNPQDLIIDADAFESDELALCGASKAHSGFVRALKEYMLNDVWENQFMPFLTKQCSSLYVTGHSLGAAVAVLFNACTNSLKQGETLHLNGGPDPAGMLKTKDVTFPSMVSKIYTFGAPGLTSTQIVNPLTSDGVFEGKRFYIEDEFTGDPIPYLAHPFGYVHPKMEAVKLESTLGGDSYTTYLAGSEEAKQKPDNAAVLATLPIGLISHLTYANRVVPMFH